MNLQNGNMKKKFVIDIDNTICTQEINYKDAKPFKDKICVINKLFDNGNEIVFFTARGTETGINWRYITETQLKKWGVKYHKLIFGKPSADYYIDDKLIDWDELKEIGCL